MSNLKRSSSLITWIILMFSAFLCDSYDSVTVVVDNEIDAFQIALSHNLFSPSGGIDDTVKFTCDREDSPSTGEAGSGTVSHGETATLKIRNSGGCQFQFYEGEFRLSSSAVGSFGRPSPLFTITTDKVFLKFNATGAYRRNKESEDWLYIALGAAIPEN